MTRWVKVVVGLVVTVVLAGAVALFVGLVAVLLGAAPLGLAGESTPTQPWVPPVVVTAAVATLVVGATLSVRRFRRGARPNGPLTTRE